MTKEKEERFMELRELLISFYNVEIGGYLVPQQFLDEFLPLYTEKLEESRNAIFN
jgi:hypothetical protein